jgi:hypothetical protein
MATDSKTSTAATATADEDDLVAESKSKEGDRRTRTAREVQRAVALRGLLVPLGLPRELVWLVELYSAHWWTADPGRWSGGPQWTQWLETLMSDPAIDSAAIYGRDGGLWCATANIGLMTGVPGREGSWPFLCSLAAMTDVHVPIGLGGESAPDRLQRIGQQGVGCTVSACHERYWGRAGPPIPPAAWTTFELYRRTDRHSMFSAGFAPADASERPSCGYEVFARETQGKGKGGGGGALAATPATLRLRRRMLTAITSFPPYCHMFSASPKATVVVGVADAAVAHDIRTVAEVTDALIAFGL